MASARCRADAVRRGGLLAGLVSVVGSLAVAADVTPPGIESLRVSRITAAPNGQMIYGIDESRRAVVAIDSSLVGRLRDVVAPAEEGSAVPVTLAALPGDILAVVCRAGDEWSLRTYRGRPAEPAAAEQPLQELRLGVAAGVEIPSLAVSRSRDWFVVAGLPPPLPPLVRAAFAGGGVRLRPEEPPVKGRVGRPLAVAVGPGDDLVMVEAAEPRGPAGLVYIGPGGRELLRLDAGLVDVRGAAFARDGSAVWVIAGEAGGDGHQPAGVWRLDAVIRDGVQAVRPTCVARLDEPVDLAAISDRSLVVVHGAGPRTVSRVDLAGPGGADVSERGSWEEAP